MCISNLIQSADSVKPVLKSSVLGGRKLWRTAMPVRVEVSCITKRDRENPHERIQGLGGVHESKRWYMPEEDIIAELDKPDSTRRWDFCVNVNNNFVWVVVAVHLGRKYLKTQPDEHPENNLLHLDPCP
jgi:Protein of unknown function (DUF3892)